jgi:hypothetical protein
MHIKKSDHPSTGGLQACYISNSLIIKVIYKILSLYIVMIIGNIMSFYELYLLFGSSMIKRSNLIPHLISYIFGNRDC